MIKTMTPLFAILHSHSLTRRAGATKSPCLGKAQGGACRLAEAPARGEDGHLREAAVMGENIAGSGLGGWAQMPAPRLTGVC